MKLHSLEKKIVIYFNSRKSKLLDRLSAVISYGPFLVGTWLLVALGMLWLDALQGIVMVIALALVFSLNVLISKGLFKWVAMKFEKKRVRPYQAYPAEIKPIGTKSLDSSFPSVHVAAMTGGLSIVVAFYAGLLVPAIAIILIMGWSRMRNGMHYPTDILAGIALGLAYGFAVMHVLKLI